MRYRKKHCNLDCGHRPRCLPNLQDHLPRLLLGHSNTGITVCYAPPSPWLYSRLITYIQLLHATPPHWICFSPNVLISPHILSPFLSFAQSISLYYISPVLSSQCSHSLLCLATGLSNPLFLCVLPAFIAAVSALLLPNASSASSSAASRSAIPSASPLLPSQPACTAGLP